MAAARRRPPRFRRDSQRLAARSDTIENEENCAERIIPAAGPETELTLRLRRARRETGGRVEAAAIRPPAPAPRLCTIEAYVAFALGEQWQTGPNSRILISGMTLEERSKPRGVEESGAGNSRSRPLPARSEPIARAVGPTIRLRRQSAHRRSFE